MASLAAASLIITRPPLAVLFVLAVITTAVIAHCHAEPSTYILVFLVLALSASVDLIGRLQLGRTTAYAWVTGMVAVTSAIVALTAPSTTVPAASRRAISLMALFPAWALLSLLWGPPSLEGLQNILVYLAFPAIVAVSAIAASTGAVDFPSLRRIMMMTYLAGSALYCASLATDGIGGNAIVSARAFALFAAVGVGWSVALARFGYHAELRLALLLVTLIFMSLSRTAFVASLGLLALGLLGFRTTRDLSRSIAVVGCIGLLSVAAYSYSNPFSSRFTQGDVVTLPGGVAINVMGRSDLWRATWDSALRSPLRGQGAGSADAVVSSISQADDNPHNDYLRVFHDLGIVGIALLGLAFSCAMLGSAAALRATLRARTDLKSLHLASILTLLVLSIEMTTDNSLVYLFVLAPVAVVVGVSLGVRSNQTATSPR